jgi:tRNA dimethylallyltransferase
MRLAERAPLTVVSADSRQVYRGFDVGTAKPTAEERRRVPHRGIDVVAPVERYSAARWAADAHAWIDEQMSRLRLVRAGDGSSAYAPVMLPPPTAPGGPQHETGAAPTGCMVNPARAEGGAA